MRKVLKVDEWLHQKHNDKVIEDAVQRVIDKWAKIGIIGMEKSKAIELLKAQANTIFTAVDEAIQSRI
jgi:hypothetical protein